jgi:hypothetical protein
MGRDLTAWQDDHRRPLPTTCAKPSETSASEQVVRTKVSQVRSARGSTSWPTTGSQERDEIPGGPLADEAALRPSRIADPVACRTSLSRAVATAWR